LKKIFETNQSNICVLFKKITLSYSDLKIVIRGELISGLTNGVFLSDPVLKKYKPNLF